MSFSKQLAFPDADNEREDERHLAGVGARVQRLRSTPNEVTVTDISKGGCRLQCRTLAEGDEIWVVLPGLRPVRARIVWAKGQEAGCEFHIPLGRADMRKFLVNRFGTSPEPRPQVAHYHPVTPPTVALPPATLKILGTKARG